MPFSKTYKRCLKTRCNNNKLSKKFVTNLESCKKLRVNLKNTLGLLQRQSLVKIKAYIFKPGLAF